MSLAPIYIVIPLLTVLAVGLLGRSRRIGFSYAILISVLLTPVVGFMIALASGPRRDYDE